MTSTLLERAGQSASRLYRPPSPAPHERPLGFFKLVSTLKRNPLECWTKDHFEEPLVVGGLPFVPVVVVSEPAAIRHILIDNKANYHKDFLARRVLSTGLAEGLLSVEGEDWRAQRRTLAALFTPRKITDFAPPMFAAAQALVERWRCKDGAVLDVAAEMTSVTVDILQRTILSDGLGCAPEAFRAAMNSYLGAIGEIGFLDVVGAPQFIQKLFRPRASAAMTFFEATIGEILSARRRRLADTPECVPNDLLNLLLNARDPATGAPMSEAEVRSNILTFMMAGHETTAAALGWSVFLLSQAPEWRERVLAEIERENSPSDESIVDRFVETRAVIEETLRLYPPIAAFSRAALGPDELAGLKIRRGTLVVIAPYVVHRHRLLWNNPDHFDPGRFLGDARTKIDRLAYLPFGAGPRVCIGTAFALQEAVIILTTILKNFNLQLCEGHVAWPMLRVTLRPAGGLPMRLSVRPVASERKSLSRRPRSPAPSHPHARASEGSAEQISRMTPASRSRG